MDRSFLSQKDVVAASRRFVCVRLTTYENEEETKFMASVFARGGAVENTTFALLGPDGQKKLSRAGRSARQVFADAAEMARRMNEIADWYLLVETPGGTPGLPVALDARIGLDVAASDGQPLVAIVAGDEKTRAALEARVAGLAWGSEFVGRFVYASAASARELKNVEGLPMADGVVVVVEPDAFGQKGKVVASVALGATPEQVAAALRKALADHARVAKDMRQHRLEGERTGAFWDTKLPVTDKQEEAARERTKRAIERQKRE